jgi:hypothetical protein
MTEKKEFNSDLGDLLVSYRIKKRGTGASMTL